MKIPIGQRIISLFFVIISPAFAQDHFSHIETIINQTNLDSLVSYVRILTGEDSVQLGDSKVLIQDRKSNQGRALAAEFIRQKLNSFNLEATEQIYSNTGKNIIATQTGTLYPDNNYIICAHFDAVTGYCADDNASGVATVLESARILSKYQLEYTLIYALWDQEEPGTIGSMYYASQAASSNMDIRGVVNLEMLGWDGNNDAVMDIDGSNVSNSTYLTNYVFNIISIYDLPLNPVIFNPGAGGSDHWPFWNEGFGATAISQAYYGGDFNPYYHSTGDRIDKFNLPFFQNLAKLAIGSVSSLVFVIEDSSLPVELSSFDAKAFPNQVSLKWTTQSELINFGFELERAWLKINNSEIPNFEKIGFIPGQGNNSTEYNYQFIDSDLPGKGLFQYRLRQIDLDGSFIFSPIVEVEIGLQGYALYQNYPNPFNGITTIPIRIQSEGLIELIIYNAVGQKVMVVLNENMSAGIHELRVNSFNFSSGIYLYRLVVNNEIITQRKMLLIK
jgi:hypothetical protein